MRKIIVWVLLLCTLLCFTACGNTASTIPPEETSGTITDVITPTPSETSTVEPENTTDPTTPDETQTTLPATSSAEGTTSKPSNPPATTSQPPAPPTTSTPPPPTSTPDTPPTTSIPPLTTSTPTYTEADYTAIIKTIRDYGEAKDLVWNDSFAFGQAGLGYYARPNLERDGYSGVVAMLKYNIDTILAEYGVCYFKVIKMVYEGNTEFVVLYA